MTSSYATGNVIHSVFKLMEVRPPFFQDPYTSILPPAMRLASWIHHLPIQHRKAILDACRIQSPVWINKTLASTFACLPPVTIYPETQEHLSIITLYPNDFAKILDDIVWSPSTLSLISYLVRAESTIHLAEFLNEKTVSLDKELTAALWYETSGSKLSYDNLMDVQDTHMHPQLRGKPSKRVRMLFKQGIQHIQDHFSRQSTSPLLPSYSGRKNVSYETCRNFYHAIGSSIAESIPTDVTTKDILKLYYNTGLEVGGSIEMRQAWFFNDLKPRTYYALGGNDFFTGMYIQQISNLFVNMIPSTNTFSRYSVSRLGPVNYDELLITYDYSSFTTSLSELQYFMFYLARSVGSVVVTVLDVARGLVEYPLSFLLDHYNQLINHHQVFSLERFQDAEEYCKVHQGRNGSLGVKGNIVFSTTLHGLALADITGTPDNDCCVGDDALAVIRSYFLTMFIACVNNLGDINPTKFTTIRRIDVDDETESPYLSEQYKFLKRPLNLDLETGVPTLGQLDFFPDVCSVLFPEGDGVHSATPGYSRYGSGKTFAMQVGRYFRLHCNGRTPPRIPLETEGKFLLATLQKGYESVGLPIEGGIPGGFLIRVDRTGKLERLADFFCPPVDTMETFQTPWMSLLLDRFYGNTVSLPIRVGGSLPPPLVADVGLRFHATSDIEVLQLLVDLEVLEKKVEMEYHIFDQTICERVWDMMMGDLAAELEPMLCEFEVISPTPVWWFDVVKYFYPDSSLEDPLAAFDRISTVMSGSGIN